MRRQSILVLAIVVILLADTNPCNAVPVLYEIVDLGTLGADHSEAHAINNFGQIVGYSYITGDNYCHAFIYENNNMRDINPQIGNPENSGAYGVNDAGQVFGRRTGGKSWFLDTEGTLRTLAGQAYAMNESGMVVGHTINSYGDTTACIFDFTNFITIDLGLGYNSEAHAINNNGLITGWVEKGGKRQGFLYDNGSISYFGSSFGDNIQPFGINDNGQIIGWCDGNAFLYEDGVMISIEIDYPKYINNLGQIVGTNNGDIACIYENGVITELGFLPGGNYSIASAINDEGWIVGDSGINGQGAANYYHAVLWKPIPEPTTFLLFGLGALMLRRKRVRR